jgi:hypothetical protein
MPKPEQGNIEAVKKVLFVLLILLQYAMSVALCVAVLYLLYSVAALLDARP